MIARHYITLDSQQQKSNKSFLIKPEILQYVAFLHTQKTIMSDAVDGKPRIAGYRHRCKFYDNRLGKRVHHFSPILSNNQAKVWRYEKRIRLATPVLPAESIKIAKSKIENFVTIIIQTRPEFYRWIWDSQLALCIDGKIMFSVREEKIFRLKPSKYVRLIFANLQAGELRWNYCYWKPEQPPTFQIPKKKIK